MRIHRHEPALNAVVETYVTPGRRYLQLVNTPFLSDPAVRQPFGRALAEDAVRVTDGELELLLGYEWRAQLTASWLVAFARRAAHRERIGELLLANERAYAGRGFCFALARLGTEADARVLVDYLHAFLPRTDRGEQDSAMGALTYLDGLLGTDHAAQFLADNGPWARWLHARFPLDLADVPVSLDQSRDLIADQCSYADQCMKALPSAP
ncbi:DUF6000 family protein [Amycolatopsis carbonis]|uniref:DUF6000 family protein n=1 Tax=Amycolatopsis carbonis TaxID=715471 RepID=A0A9Y2IQ14_9PSEU|nr:DUF6000 family protein [Amycolatopsis sp. 2-15]WIX83190.1 DUF6000 family protein [Amycolatopsis sp. 2-15]